MALELREDEFRCPDCGSVNKNTAGQCWLCRRRLSADVDAERNKAPRKLLNEPPKAKPASGPAPTSGEMTFHLDSLMLTITLVAVCLGVVSLWPGLGVLFAVVSTPAFVRTALAANRRKRAGARLSVGGKVTSFAASLLVVITVGVAAGVAFYITCWIGFCGALALSEIMPAKEPWLSTSLGIGVTAGIAVGLLVAGLLLWKMWPTERRNRR